MLQVYTESEWFDAFYPKAWGDWRTHYNIRKYVENQCETACCWMDYGVTGRLGPVDERTGLMKVVPHHPKSKKKLLHAFFVECGDVTDEAGVAWFLQPYLQHKVGKYFAKVWVSRFRRKGKGTRYSIYVAGHDDSSYTKILTDPYEVQKEIDRIKVDGVDHIQDIDSGYEFTN